MRASSPTSRLVDLVAAFEPVFVFTGAGVSNESGLETFRDASGLWAGVDPMAVATPEAFASDPGGVWRFYEARRRQAAAARPNAAHRAVRALEATGRPFLLATQNVDGLHERAGSRNVIRLHGDLWTLRCARCGAERVDRTVPLAPLPPRCACGGFERPGVVWFGESLPAGALEAAGEAVANADVVLVVGTSAVVWPAAGLVPLALAAGVPVIEVNPEATAFSDRVLAVRAPAGEALPALID